MTPPDVQVKYEDEGDEEQDGSGKQQVHPPRTEFTATRATCHSRVNFKTAATKARHN